MHRTPAALLLFMAVACSGGGSDDTAVRRGDVAFARDSLDEALAEYRLAVRQGQDDATTLARVGHTYTLVGRVDEAGDFWALAVRQDSSLAAQAAADFVHMARRAAERNDRFQMASAMDAALTFVPGLSVEHMALPLARHYFRSGQYGRALPFYQKALVEAPDSAPDLVFEIGQAYEEIGDCQRALVFFEQYREMVEQWERSEVDWYVGNCAFQLARDLRANARGMRAREQAGERSAALEEALRLANRTIEVGEPRNVQGQAWFERAEIQAALGDCDGALDSFRRVGDVEPSRNSALARRAQERFDQIRFGRGLRDLTSTGACG